MRVGPRANKRVVLRRDAAVELGGASAASCACVLSTGDASLVRDGRIGLWGPDMGALSSEKAVPFAQIVLVAGRGMGARDALDASSCQQVKDYVEGYLVRSMPGQVWGRVSRELLSKGFGFAALGAALQGLVRETVPRAERVETLFVTSPEGLGGFEPIVREALRVSHEVRKGVWLGRGIDIDCPYGGHCGTCGLKETCDEIRKMKRIRGERKERAHVQAV